VIALASGKKDLYEGNYMSSDITDLWIEQWRNLKIESSANSEWVKHNLDRDAKRRIAQGEMVKFLKKYLSGDISTEEFKLEFDRRTRKEWDLFGLKGMSGAMFLNMLVKYAPDAQVLSNQLKLVLQVPPSSEQGRQMMANFISFIDNLIKSGQVTRRQLQSSRAPFFISAWWHLQSLEQWPVFYISARNALEKDGLYSPAQDLTDDYFTFRDVFLALASGLELTSWELEQLCVWYEANPRGPKIQIVTESTVEPEILNDSEVPTHTQVQWLLAKIGRKLGCRIWIAANDQNKEWQGKRLSDLSLKDMPHLGMVDSDVQRRISLIDVLWIKGNNQIAGAFEVEQTTSIFSGLLRLSDLVVLVPILNFPLYIVSPRKRMEQVKSELSRPTFQYLELHKRCGFFASEDLLKEAENIMGWASDPSAINRLALKVDDIMENRETAN